jgi:ribosomal protein S18 acetylase RimI-like enzyme
MSDLLLRQARKEDAEDVARLYARAYGDARRLDAEEVRWWFRNETLQPEWLRVLERAGEVVGYGDIVVHEDEVGVDLAAPGHWGPFLDWAEGVARAADVPRVRVYFPPNEELEKLLSRRRYRLWRSSYTMEGPLDEPAPPQLPDGFALKPYRPDVDENELRTTINEVFRSDPFFHEVSPARFREEYLRARGYDPSLWLHAWRSGELAGFALALPEHAGNAELGWIESLGVREHWRHRGLGEALLRAVFRELYSRGLRRVGLGVDAENETGALSLYERVGLRPVSRGDNWVLDL